ncbi:hypothetical protein AVEN_153090-1 [Araneus ventricosus]|uniref:Uncharacterized protein n=1 Tax=Araneus ventricosus TaxID=182803 RepID=A0A4Y2E5F1_ARAVE|nr:hypothetical protein AVEN_153090-1 [Araneus ventricosus]
MEIHGFFKSSPFSALAEFLCTKQIKTLNGVILLLVIHDKITQHLSEGKKERKGESSKPKKSSSPPNPGAENRLDNRTSSQSGPDRKRGGLFSLPADWSASIGRPHRESFQSASNYKKPFEITALPDEPESHCWVNRVAP